MAVMTAPNNGMKIRMYRRGLGDCFLLAFGTPGNGNIYMMIDCGVLYDTTEKPKKMKQIAKHIKESTNNHVHILVITHEHYDHLCGFRFTEAKGIFQDMRIDEVWAAWTESPTDSDAQDLQMYQSMQLRGLELAARRIRAFDPVESSKIQSLLAFSQGVRDDRDFALERGRNPTKFLSPEDPPFFLPGNQNVRIYVLGPPKDVDLLKRSDTSGQGEIYEEPSLAFDEWTPFLSAVLASKKQKLPPEEEEKLAEWKFPFDENRQVVPRKAKKESFFRESYGFPGQAGPQGEEWRRIDNDWLAAASDLAVQLDNRTNNTCLVLAIELLPSGRVLLFPGDAQVSNMLSWHDLSWTIGGQRVTTRDLLNRTAFYKVGHHGSHNATLKEKGLEMMNSQELTAMIPVYESMARQKHWKMPFPPLFKRLKEKTRGRLIQADKGMLRKPRSVSRGDWNDFKRKIEKDRTDKLWVDYKITNP